MPLLVTVVELAETIGEGGLGATDDLLGAHVRRTEKANGALADWFIARRAQRKLVVLLDGVDEAGAVRAVLEPYVAKRLAGEVMLCVTGRENGIEDMGIFAGFAHFHIQALTEAQQRFIVASRVAAAAGVRKGEVTTDERVRARGCSPFQHLFCVECITACCKRRARLWVVFNDRTAAGRYHSRVGRVGPRWTRSWRS